MFKPHKYFDFNYHQITGVIIADTLTKIYSLLRRKSKLSSSNKLLIYKTVLKPIWTCVIQLWGTASTSNIEILERFQSKALRMIVAAPWHVPNTVIRRDLQIQQLNKKSAATALNIVLNSAHIQMT
jgi:hypothetical protein